MEKLLVTLNSDQRSVVESNSRFCQIVAGPGTGKTTTLAAKILFTQIEHGIDADNILGISFSRAAKSQLLGKLEEYTTLLGYGAKPRILTFHSLAHRIIKYAIHFQESRFRANFRLIETDEFIKYDPALIKDLCSDYKDRDLINKVLSEVYNLIRQGSNYENKAISHWKDVKKNTFFKVQTYSHGRVLINSEDLILFWKRINKIEKIKNVTDFQGLITEANRVLSLKGHTYENITKQIRHIFVDEYQDTSISQEELLFHLINEDTFVTVVGDKNQTIYTFNGSNSENMDRFSFHCNKFAPESFKKFHLKLNYRSTTEIINLANHFIGSKTLYSSKNKFGKKPEVIETHSIQLAAHYISQKIVQLVNNSNFSYSDICILYRKNSEFSPQANEVIKQLTNCGIPIKESLSSSDQYFSLVDEVFKIREDFDDHNLDEILDILIKKNASTRLIKFIKDCIYQGAINIDDLTDYIIDLNDNSLETMEQYVSIKSVHDAKGQEFPIVFVLYLGDREFPHSSTPDIEEEKRLLYVAITRAKNQLFILGQRGIEFESFLDKCLFSDVSHVVYQSKINEEKNNGLKNSDKEIINETTRQLEIVEQKQKEELRRLMEFF